MSSIDNAVFSRRSVRKYLNLPVERHFISQILESGAHAPSSGNLQNWKVIIVQNPEIRQKIAQASFHQLWMSQAPVHIVICADTKVASQFYGKRGEMLYSVQNCAAMAQTMILKATELGFGTCWVSAFDEVKLKVVLALPDSIRPQTIITLGHADEVTPAPLLKDPSDYITFDTYANKNDPLTKDLQFKNVGNLNRRMVQGAGNIISDIVGEFKKIFRK
ncbi:MAG TPA: nitroreductase family protein [Acidobacteriota bacterium]|nr:nitroreductase family protein [Acidobacteriota bacterium]